MHPSPQAGKPGQLLLGLLCGAGGLLPWAWSVGPSLPCGRRREGMPSEPAQLGHKGPCPAALPSPDLTAHGHKHNLLPSAQGGDSPIPSDKSRVKVIPWDCQVPSKALGGSRCQGAEEDPWCADHSCFFQLDQQLPTHQSSWKICLGMFG